jgi:hypothetical protein
VKDPLFSVDFDPDRTFENQNLFFVRMPMGGHADAAWLKDLLAYADFLSTIDLTRPTPALHARTPLLPRPFPDQHGYSRHSLLLLESRI